MKLNANYVGSVMINSLIDDLEKDFQFKMVSFALGDGTVVVKTEGKTKEIMGAFSYNKKDNSIEVEEEFFHKEIILTLCIMRTVQIELDEMKEKKTNGTHTRN